jgi:hypothetical protein
MPLLMFGHTNVVLEAESVRIHVSFRCDHGVEAEQEIGTCDAMTIQKVARGPHRRIIISQVGVTLGGSQKGSNLNHRFATNMIRAVSNMFKPWLGFFMSLRAWAPQFPLPRDEGLSRLMAMKITLSVSR